MFEKYSSRIIVEIFSSLLHNQTERQSIHNNTVKCLCSLISIAIWTLVSGQYLIMEAVVANQSTALHATPTIRRDLMTAEAFQITPQILVSRLYERRLYRIIPQTLKVDLRTIQNITRRIILLITSIIKVIYIDLAWTETGDT